jgi:hypothetical protein
VSLLLYAATLAALLVGRSRPAILREARITWTAGCIVLWLHLAAAFHFYHDWSHQVAYEATARDTEATIGWAFGGGVYLNYLFALLWTVDAAWWWSIANSAHFRRSRWASALVHGFLFFIAFNATVTFAEGALRWTAVAICVGLAILGFISRNRSNLQSWRTNPRLSRPSSR